MRNAIIPGKKTLTGRQYSIGVCGIVELTDTMYAVVALDINKQIIFSRNFMYTQDCKKEILKDCRKTYNNVKDILAKKQLNLLEDL